MKKTLLFVAASVVLLAAPGTADATVWDVEADYVLTNPSGQWSYRSGTPGDRDSNALLSTYDAVLTTWNPLLAGGGWSDGGGWSSPYYIFNENAAPQQWWSSIPEAIPVGAAFGYPYATGDLVLSWLAPSAMTVDISMDLTWLQNHEVGLAGIDWYIDKNNMAGNLASGIFSYGTMLTGQNTGVQTVNGLSVVGGDRINLVIDAKGLGSADGVFTNFTITDVLATPPTPIIYTTGPWDFADQYSATVNVDANTWSYRSGISSNKTTSTRFPGTVGAPLVQWIPDVGASDGWGKTAGGVFTHAYFIKNDGSGPSQVWPSADPVIPASPVGAAFGSPSDSEDAVLSWLAPSAMTVDISMDLTWLQDHETGNNGIDWFITLNDTPIIAGDANEDGRVDGSDAVILAANWLKIGGAILAEGDFNGDGDVNDLDATIMATNWGQLGAGVLASGTFGSETSSAGESTGIQSVLGVSVLAGDRIKLVLDSLQNGGNDAVYIDFSIAVSAAAVPEPGVCVLLAGMMLLLVARRRR